VQKFYQGLTMASRTIIDASAGGSIIELTSTQAFTLFKKVANNDTWASSGRLLPFQPTVSVRNVVPTLTSNERQGLSLNGRCQAIRDRVLSWFRPRGRTSSSGVLGALYCSAPGCL
jgi:hypothetical protein